MSRTAQVWRDRGQLVEDRGTSLAELLIAMSIFAVVGTMLVTGVLTLTPLVGRSSNLATASGQGSEAFVRLDRAIRSASAINRPALVGAAWYLEVETAVTGTATCTQWRLTDSTDTLAQRTWRTDTGAVTQLSSWTDIASGVVNSASAVGEAPFSFLPADAVVLRQSVEVRLLLRQGPGQRSGSAATSTRLVARNTSTATSTNPDANGDGRSDVEVCRQVALS